MRRTLRSICLPPLAWFQNELTKPGLHGLLAGLILLTSVAPSIALAQAPIRVNVGGPQYTSQDGTVWAADTGFNGGIVWWHSFPVAGTNDLPLHQSARYVTASMPDLKYTFAVPNGVYDVHLHFSENWSGAHSVGGRLFSIKVEDEMKFPNLDIFAEAGAHTALVKSTAVSVTDGTVDIHFLTVYQVPAIYAIEIVSRTAPSRPEQLVASGRLSGVQVDLGWQPSVDDVGVSGYELERCEGAGCSDFSMIAATSAPSYADGGLTPGTTYRYRVRSFDTDGNRSDFSDIVSTDTPPSAMAAIRVNVGGGQYTAQDGNIWVADTGYNTGNVGTTTVPITGTTDPVLFSSGRGDLINPPDMEYAFNLPNGEYTANLLFAEMWSGGHQVGGRVFHIAFEGTTVFNFVDVFAEVGAFAALTKSTPVTVADGQINIRFLHHITHPFVCAIEIVPDSSADSLPPSVPGQFNAAAVSATESALSWASSTDNVAVAGYEIERCSGLTCSDFQNLGNTSNTLYSDTTVAPGAIHRYRVRAYDAAGNYSGYSNVEVTQSAGGGVPSELYQYDALGRLTQVTFADGTVVTYQYDALGNRVSQTTTAPQ